METDSGETIRLLQVARSEAQEAQAARDALFERYYPRVLRIVEARMGRRLRDEPEIEDVCQETLLDAFRGLHDFEYRSQGDFCNWLARIAQNNVRDHFRRSKAQKRGEGFVRLNCDAPSTSLTESIFPGKEPTPSENARKNELEQRIEHALANEIGERYREAILLRDLCGMEYVEIAATMGYAGASTARALYTRAKQRLKECL